MSSKYFETESSSSGRRLYIQLWFGMVQYGNRIEHPLLHTGLLILLILTHENVKSVKVKQPRYRPGVARGFQEVKIPRFHDNGTGWW